MEVKNDIVDHQGAYIELSGSELTAAVLLYAASQGAKIRGSTTVVVNGAQGRGALILVDPAGYVILDGEKVSGQYSVAR